MNRERIELTIDGPHGETVKIIAKEQKDDGGLFDTAVEEWELIEGSMIRTSLHEKVVTRDELPTFLQQAACSGISFSLLPYPARLPSKRQAS